MTPLVLYWVAFAVLCVVVVAGTVVRQRWVRRRQQQITTTDAEAMGEGDAALGSADVRPDPAGGRTAPVVGAAVRPAVERRRGGDRRRNRSDRRAQAHA